LGWSLESDWAKRIKGLFLLWFYGFGSRSLERDVEGVYEIFQRR
jgi:hypothetical protein